MWSNRPVKLQQSLQKGYYPIVLMSANALTSPSQAKKAVNYTESGDEEDDAEDDFAPVRTNKTRGRALKRRRVAAQKESDEDDFVKDEDTLSVEEGESCPLAIVTL